MAGMTHQQYEGVLGRKRYLLWINDLHTGFPILSDNMD
jgi:hypothetical protein